MIMVTRVKSYCERRVRVQIPHAMFLLKLLKVFMYAKLILRTISRPIPGPRSIGINHAVRARFQSSYARHSFILKQQMHNSGVSDDMEVAVVATSSSGPPATMLSFLQKKVASGLESWKKFTNEESDMNMSASETAKLKEELARKLIDGVLLLQADSNSKDGNKQLYEIGLSLSKALRVKPGDLADISSGKATVQTILAGYKQHLEANRAVFTDITKHHESLVQQPWEKAVAKQTSLQTYADAANAMGQKAWVKEGNQWMENFAISFFRRNGARKDYLKTIQHDHNYTAEEFSNFSVTIPRDLMALSSPAVTNPTTSRDSTSSSSSISGDARGGGEAAGGVDISERTSPSSSSSAYSKIRLLDVGSCYNPIAKSANASAFDVTALDLCPVDTSVHQCDFLALNVGSEGSLPIYGSSSAATIGTSSLSTTTTTVPVGGEEMTKPSASTAVSASKLLQLPAASYDVVTMSLVLNYLPTPEKRVAMIRKARELLRPPGFGGQPHHAGLLLIIEKESIFSFDVLNQTESAPCSKNNLMSCWKESIRSCGFELVKYRNLLTSEDNRKCHAFAFRAVAIPTAPSALSAAHNDHSSATTASISTGTSTAAIAASTTAAAATKGVLSSGSGLDCTTVTMWIRQDFLIDSNPSSSSRIHTSKLLDTVTSSLETVQKAAAAAAVAVAATSTASSTTATASISEDVNTDMISTTCSGRILGISNENNSSSSRRAPLTVAGITSTTEEQQRRLPIAVVGGGLGGVALTLALQTRGLPVRLFEKDAGFSSRPQGYALTIQQGLSTLRMIGLGILEQLQQRGGGGGGGGERGADGSSSSSVSSPVVKEGVTSLAHESYTSDGRLLGAYGASARRQQQEQQQEQACSNNLSGASSISSSALVGSDQDKDSVRDDGLKSDNGSGSDSDSDGDVATTTSDVVVAPSSSLPGAMPSKDKKKGGRRNVHVPRQRLREILLSHIQPSNIEWNKRLLRFEEHGNNGPSSKLSSPSPSSLPAAGDSDGIDSDGIGVKRGGGGGGVKLYFEDGSEFECSVLVAADGIHSTIRRQLLLGSKNTDTATACSSSPTATSADATADDDTNAAGVIGATTTIGDTVVSRGIGGGTGLQYLGLMVILGISPVVMGTGGQILYSFSQQQQAGDRVDAKIGDKRQRDDSDSSHTPSESNDAAIDDYITGEVLKQGGRRQIQWLDGTTRIFTMPFDGRRTMWQLSFPLSEEHALGLSASPRSLKEEALRRCAGWHEPLVRMLSETEDGFVSGHPAYDREPLRPQELSKYKPESLVTLLGDAAHPMSPFKAQGANQALLDARSLTRTLVSSDFGRPGKGRRSVSDALRSYEAEMCTRSAVKVLKSRAAAQYLHSPAALAEGNVTRAYAAEGATSTDTDDDEDKD